MNNQNNLFLLKIREEYFQFLHLLQTPLCASNLRMQLTYDNVWSEE